MAVLAPQARIFIERDPILYLLLAQDFIRIESLEVHIEQYCTAPIDESSTEQKTAFLAFHTKTRLREKPKPLCGVLLVPTKPTSHAGKARLFHPHDFRVTLAFSMCSSKQKSKQ